MGTEPREECPPKEKTPTFQLELRPFSDQALNRDLAILVVVSAKRERL